MKISSVLVLALGFSLISWADSTPAPVTSPAVNAAAIPTPKPTPAPDPAKICYIQMSEATISASKECEGGDRSSCSKKFKTCRWDSHFNKCFGLIYSYCGTGIPKKCEEGYVGVTTFPPNLAKTNLKFKCKETSPVKLTPIKN